MEHGRITYVVLYLFFSTVNVIINQSLVFSNINKRDIYEVAIVVSNFIIN